MSEQRDIRAAKELYDRSCGKWGMNTELAAEVIARVRAEGKNEAQRELARDAVTGLWSALRTVAHSRPELCIPAEVLDFCGTPDKFIAYADGLLGRGGSTSMKEGGR